MAHPVINREGSANSFSLSELAPVLAGRVTSAEAGQVRASGVISRAEESYPGAVFIAVRGARSDGHQFVGEARRRGAVAAVVTQADALKGLPGIVVQDGRRALSRAAAWCVGEPARALTNIAITGTNGKTTTNWIIHHTLEALGVRSLRIGTLGLHAHGVLDLPGVLTSPDPITLHRVMAAARKAGVSTCVMESSSHALDQLRVEDVPFDVGVFTNLTRDHLDYHNDMESYYQAKRRLFDLVAAGARPNRSAVINLDSAEGQRLWGECAQLDLRRISYGFSPECEVRIARLESSIECSRITIDVKGGPHLVTTGLIGRHNASNLAAALGALLARGFGVEEVIAAFRKIPQVPGRLESVSAPGFGIYVDYAHTPDALENVLLTLRELTPGKLWVVFGCGGDRDRGKRPQMAQVAARLADRVVVTSDNPRSEDPEQIMRDILAAKVAVERAEVDRAQAIRYAVHNAAEGDVVLIAGKGHEDYQIIGAEKSYFSDVEQARSAVASRQGAV